MRVQGFALASLELENQDGPVQRQLIQFFASALFPSTTEIEARPISLVFDELQLALLLRELQALNLPDATDEPVPTAQ